MYQIRRALRLPLAVVGLALAATPAAAAKWGAVAFSESTGSFGKSWNFSSKDEAGRRAMAECEKHAKDCKIVQTVSSADRGPETCLALAVLRADSKTAEGVQTTRSTAAETSADRQEAQSRALDRCADVRTLLLRQPSPPEASCRLVVSLCSRTP